MIPKITTIVNDLVCKTRMDIIKNNSELDHDNTINFRLRDITDKTIAGANKTVEIASIISALGWVVLLNDVKKSAPGIANSIIVAIKTAEADKIVMRVARAFGEFGNSAPRHNPVNTAKPVRRSCPNI